MSAAIPPHVARGAVRIRRKRTKNSKRVVGQEYIPIFAAGGLLTHSFSAAPHCFAIPVKVAGWLLVMVVGEDNRLKLLRFHCQDYLS